MPDCVPPLSVFAHFANVGDSETDLDSQRKLSIDAVGGLGVLLGRHFAVLLPTMLLSTSTKFRGSMRVVLEFHMSWRN